MPIMAIVLLVIAAVIVLVGLVGLVLLIVGIAKKRTALWVCGLVAMVLAGLALLVGVPLVLFVGLRVASEDGSRAVAVHADLPPGVEAEPRGGGCSITHADGRVTAHVEGVEIEVIEPGSGGSHSSSRSSGGVFPGSRESRHEIGVGNVRILVGKRDGRITLSVNGRPCGRIHPGDSVVITPDREVLINGGRRLP